MIYALIDRKVSDIYIVEELGFDLINVANVLHKNNINVRIFPNVAQSK